MFTPRKRGSSTKFASPSKKVPLYGLFKDGNWHCNCDPRKPASHFQVKKEGPNTGKWFYTCQESKDDGCGFFLWDDKAVTREMYAVINNTRSEPDSHRSAIASAGAGNSIQIAIKEDEDDFGDWPLSQEEERNVEQTASSALFETPRKAIKTAPFMTPGSKRKREEAVLPTPSTTDDIFRTPATTKANSERWDGKTPFGLRSPSQTPTPMRFHDAEPSSQNTSYDITEEVMELLKGQKIDEDTALNLRGLLNRHAMKMSGIAKGRDITRVALKAKDKTIAELRQRISSLEAEREMDKVVIKHFKNEMINEARGRG